MKILRAVYESLLCETPTLPPETGGILGGRCGTITHYRLDKGRCTLASPAHYQPDIELLNRVIQQWQSNKIDFHGVFHSHYPHDTELSFDDRKYITKIMLAMPPEICSLYFPLILPRRAMISYQANRYGSGVHIVCDKIEIFKTEVSLR